MQLAYKLDRLPASVVADLSLARLMATELDGLLRRALDVSLAEDSEMHDVYTDITYSPRDLARHDFVPRGED